MLDPLSIIQKHYTIGSELYNTLVSHSQDVAQKALEIVQMHPNLNADADFVFQAAMLHDIGIYLTHAPNIHCH